MGSREFNVGGYSDDASIKAQLIKEMQSFMQRNNVRYAQLAVSTKGHTQLSTELAFTWSEPNSRQSTISDIFLLASVSKAFCSAAVYNAFKGEDVSKICAFPFLNYQSVPTTDPRANSITIQHLLDHKAGYVDSRDGYDYTYNARKAAAYLGHDVHTAEDLVKYAWAQPLGYTPGQPPNGKDYVYSNFSYVILSRLVEVKTDMSYSDYLHSAVLKPLQIPEVITIPTQKANYPHDYFPVIVPESAEGHDPWHDYSGPPSYDYNSKATVPTVFGGDGMVKEACEGAASLGCRAGLLAVFARHYAAWGYGPRKSGQLWTRSGSTPGASSWMVNMPNGVDLGVVMNTRDFNDGNSKIEDTLFRLKGANPSEMIQNNPILSILNVYKPPQ